jgi:hypothetical protein
LRNVNHGRGPKQAPPFYRHSPRSTDTEREPPQDLEAERCILGSILLDNKAMDALDAAVEKLKPEHFTELHQRIYRQMISLREMGSAIDLVILNDDLKKSGKLESCGGPEYISQLMDGRPTVTNIEHYARIVIEKSKLRALINLAQSMEQQAYDAEEDADTIRDRAREAINIEAGSKKSTVTVYTPAELSAVVADTVDYLVYPFAARGIITLLDGAAKAAGKTTLLLTGLDASRRGALFLNRATQRMRVLYVTEENPRPFRLALDRAGLTSATEVHLLLTSLAGMPWPQLVRHIEQKCVELKIDWLVVDTFYAVAGLGGEAENDAGAVDEAVAPLRSITGRLDLGLTITRHTRKSGGQIGESGRGSTALTGAVDSILELKRLPGTLYPERRQLEITGRVEQARMEIELRDGLYIIAPDLEVDSSIGEADRAASAISANPTATIRELEKVTGIGKNRIVRLAASKGWRKEGDQWLKNLS